VKSFLTSSINFNLLACAIFVIGHGCLNSFFCTLTYSFAREWLLVLPLICQYFMFARWTIVHLLVGSNKYKGLGHMPSGRNRRCEMCGGNCLNEPFLHADDLPEAPSGRSNIGSGVEGWIENPVCLRSFRLRNPSIVVQLFPLFFLFKVLILICSFQSNFALKVAPYPIRALRTTYGFSVGVYYVLCLVPLSTHTHYVPSFGVSCLAYGLQCRVTSLQVRLNFCFSRILLQVRDCVAVGFSLADIRSAGYSADEALYAFPGLFTCEELTQAGYLHTSLV